MTTKKIVRKKPTGETKEETVTVKFKKLYNTSRLPEFMHKEDACADLYAYRAVYVPPRGMAQVGTGIASEIPEGYEGQIRSRSGWANDYSVQAHGGTIDSGYRGEWIVLLFNHSTMGIYVREGDRIAQVAIREVPKVAFEEVKELSKTKRGSGGLGSTGA